MIARMTMPVPIVQASRKPPALAKTAHDNSMPSCHRLGLPRGGAGKYPAGGLGQD